MPLTNVGPCVGDSRDGRFGGGSWFQLAQSTAPYAAGVLCEREPPGAGAQTCDGGRCIAVKGTLGKKSYLFVPQQQTAAEADQFCRGLGKNGRLVVLESREEREELMKEVARELAPLNPRANDVWIGLSRSGDAGAWTWDDGRPVTALPDPWGEREPDPAVSGPARAYAGFGTTRAFDVQLAHADALTTKRPFVCQY